MTRANRTIYANNYLTTLKRMEERFVGKIYKALRTVINQFIFDSHYGLDYAKSRLTTQLLNSHIAKPVMDIYLTAGLMNQRRTRSTIREQKALTMGRNEVLTQEIRRYFNEHLFDKVVLPISETTKEIILRAVTKGQEEGWSVSRIVTEIGKTDITRNRARKIVRTETVRAANFGALLSAWNEPFLMTKEWISTHDNRVRHSHDLIDGQKRDLTEPFSNGLMFPGDPNGPAGETINCRCALGFEAKRDARGKLIPKEPDNGGVSVGRSLVDALIGLGISQLIENFIEDQVP